MNGLVVIEGLVFLWVNKVLINYGLYVYFWYGRGIAQNAEQSDDFKEVYLCVGRDGKFYVWNDQCLENILIGWLLKEEMIIKIN